MRKTYAEENSPHAIAERCVNSIVVDITGRCKLGNAWDEIDKDIREEIEKEWRNIIAVELGGTAQA